MHSPPLEIVGRINIVYIHKSDRLGKPCFRTPAHMSKNTVSFVSCCSQTSKR